MFVCTAGPKGPGTRAPGVFVKGSSGVNIFFILNVDSQIVVFDSVLVFSSCLSVCLVWSQHDTRFPLKKVLVYCKLTCGPVRS